MAEFRGKIRANCGNLLVVTVQFADTRKPRLQRILQSLTGVGQDGPLQGSSTVKEELSYCTQESFNGSQCLVIEVC